MPTATAERPQVRLPYPHRGQQRVRLEAKRHNWLDAGRRWRKALDVSTPIPTSTGWKRMDEIEVGDSLFDEAGAPCTVIGVAPVQYGNPCAVVRFSDGSEIIADTEHLWATSTKLERKARGRGKDVPLGIRTTAEIAETLRYLDHESNHIVPVCGPLQYPEATLEVDPYVLGVWLGDGNSDGARITSVDLPIVEQVRNAGYIVKAQKITGGRAPQWNINSPTGKVSKYRGAYAPDSLKVQLRTLDLLNNKHIPASYLTASVSQRTALLQGLMDTDGWIDKLVGRARYCSTNERLAYGAYELVTGLGFKATLAAQPAKLYGREVGTAYIISFTAHRPVFRLERKACRQRTKDSFSSHRSIVAVEPVPSVPVRCIAVDSPSSLYLASKSCIPTHNTTLLLAVALEAALVNHQRVIWGAPTYDQVRVAWDEFLTAAGGVLNFRKSEMAIEAPGGGRILFRSLDDPDNARGHSADGVVIDEAGDVVERAWYEVLRPVLLDTNGWSWAIGTPRGRNWFWREWVAAQSRDDSAAWQAPTLGCRLSADGLVREEHPYENPEIPFSEIQQLYATMPERAFRQEILAEFLEDGGGVFRGVTAVATLKPAEPYQGQFVIGCDWGRTNDWSVFSVFDVRTRKQVEIQRYNSIEWHAQHHRLVDLWQRWGGRGRVSVLAEANSIGQPAIEALRRLGVPVQPFTMTNASKVELIDALALDIERQTIGLLDDVTQTAELQAYESERLPSGAVRYSAPQGLHDDTVIATALANWASRTVRSAPRKRDLKMSTGAGSQRRDSAYDAMRKLGLV